MSGLCVRNHLINHWYICVTPERDISKVEWTAMCQLTSLNQLIFTMGQVQICICFDFVGTMKIHFHFMRFSYLLEDDSYGVVQFIWQYSSLGIRLVAFMIFPLLMCKQVGLFLGTCSCVVWTECMFKHSQNCVGSDGWSGPPRLESAKTLSSGMFWNRNVIFWHFFCAGFARNFYFFWQWMTLVAVDNHRTLSLWIH